MELTKKQNEGLALAVARYKAHEKYTVISGYAGSGKTTLVRFIIDALRVNEDKVCYATFTGKAADVLRKKGNRNAMTLHKLLYESVPLPGGGYLHKPKKHLDYTVVVIDEVSMAPKQLINELFKHRCYVICLGDPFQIPPINKDDDNHLLDHPHIFLDEIMRQAKESEIIRLSMDIRGMKPISLYDGKEVKVIEKADISTGMLLWADEILVATNAELDRRNTEVRRLLGRGQYPEDGDKVICRRNYWEDFSIGGDPLVNGSIGFLKDPYFDTVEIPKSIGVEQKSFDIINAEIETPEGDTWFDVNLDRTMMLTGKKCCDWLTAYKCGKKKEFIGDIVPREFTYGYAITTHRAQGSQWSKVLVIEENFPRDPVEHARHLYTGVTRAESKLVLVRS